MKITEDVRKYAEEKGLTADAALAEGMAEKSKEFVETGAEVYSRRKFVAAAYLRRLPPKSGIAPRHVREIRTSGIIGSLSQQVDPVVL